MVHDTAVEAVVAPPMEVRRRLRAPVGLAGGAIAVGAVIALRSPHVAGSYGFCPFLALTGYYCPGCGGLRAVHDLMQLDVLAAWGMNPLVVLAAPVVVGAWLVWVWRAWRGRAATVPSTSAIVVLAATLVVFTVARNLPALAPWLAP